MSKKRVLVVVDMQNDFISDALGTSDALAIVPSVAKKIQSYAHDKETAIICTRDTHTDEYMDTHEGRFLPVKHCVRNTHGWEIANTIKDALPTDSIIVDKPAFGSIELPDVLRRFVGEETVIELVGLCTDICVVSNALLLRAQFPENNIIVYADCCAGVTPELHESALAVMRSCHIDVL